MFKPTDHQTVVVASYARAYVLFRNAEKELEKARKAFCKSIPVGAEAWNFRHIRVHNMIPRINKLKAKGLCLKVAEMRVSIEKLRKVTKGWTVHDLRTIAKIVTHHRVLCIKPAKKGGK
jgi:hypothetical protein